MKDYLEHHGIKGQKWGVIRDLAKKRDYAKLRDFSKTSSDSFGTLSRSYSTIKDINRKSKDPSQLSDDELSKAVTRLTKERQYKELTKVRSVGEERMKKILEYGGSALAAVAAVAGIAAAVRELTTDK